MNLKPPRELYRQLSFISYYFHWDLDTVLDLPHLEREKFCREICEINREVNAEKKISSTSEKRGRLIMDPLSAYNFHVRLGLLEFGFSRVSGLQRTRETFTYQEGGLNDRVHVLTGPTKSCGTSAWSGGSIFPSTWQGRG